MGKEKIQKQSSKVRYDLSEEDFQELAGVLRTSNFPDPARSQFQEAVRDYLQNIDFMSYIPRNAKVKAALVVIRNKAKELIDCLEKLDEKSQQILWMAGYNVGGFWLRDENKRAGVLTEEKVKRARALKEEYVKRVLEKYGAEHQDEDLFREPDIYKLFSASEEALKMVKKDKGGRPKEKAALREFIRRLRPIYEEITERKATENWDQVTSGYRSRFHDFVYRCLRIVNPVDIWSDGALGEQIKKALSSKESVSHS
jgi:hypothetical protein